MKCAACGAPLSAWHRFCADCGEPRPRWPESFEACLAQFQSLTSRWEQGQLSDPEYEAGLRDLAFPYGDSYWTIGAQSGNWYRHDGQGWLKDDPLQVTTSSSSLPTDRTLAAPQPAATLPTAATESAAAAGSPAAGSPAIEPLATEPSSTEPFTLDEEDEPTRQEPSAATVSPRPAGLPGPRPTVRLNMPEVAAPAAASAVALTSAAASTPGVVQPPRVADSATLLQAQEQPQQETGLGCVRPALTGFIAALVLLCVLIVLAAWLEPSLLRPLTRLLWPGG